MKKILKLFIFIFLTVFTTNISASENCAIKDEKIEEYSYKICQQDKSFEVLYSLFPKFFEEGVFLIYDFGEIEDIKDNPKFIYDEQYQKFSNILYSVFSSITNLTIYILIFYIFYFLFFSMLKSAESGSFLDYSNKNFTKILINNGIVVFLLLPLGGLTLIQILIISISILAIAIANFVYGQYLLVFQNNIEYQEQKENEETNFLLSDYDNSPAALMAKSYVKDLVKIQVCRDITTQAILEQSIHDLKTDNFITRKSCAAGETHSFESKDTSIKKSIDWTYPSFFNVDYIDIYDFKNKSLSMNNEVTFGLTSNKYTCEPELFYNYSCGVLKSKSPKLSDNKLMEMYGIEKFVKKTYGVASGLNLTGGNQGSIEKGWQEIKSEIEQILETYKDKKEDIVSFTSKDIQGKEIADNIINKSQMHELKKMSYIYHQLILNSLTSGLALVTHTKTNENSSLFENELSSHIDDENFKALKNDWESIKDLALAVQENHCFNTSDGLNNSHQTIQMLNREEASAGTSARCIDFTEFKVFGVTPDGQPFGDKVAKDTFDSRLDNIKDLFSKKTKEVFQRRKEVEMSFIKSLEEIGERNVLNSLRQRGWLTMPTYLVEASKEVKTSNTYIKALIGSNNFRPNNIDFNGISKDITSLEDLSLENYRPMDGMSNVYKYFSNSKSDSVYNNNATFTRSLLEDNAEGLINGNASTGDQMSQLLNSVLKPIEPLKLAIGLENIESFSDQSNTTLLEQCKKDRDLCPIPKSDPLIELNKYGHYLIQNSTAYFVTLATIKGLVTTIKVGASKMKSKSQNRAGGVNEVNSGNKSVEGVSNVAGESLGKIISGADTFMSMLDIVADLLSSLMMIVIFMFIIGVFFAYILPLMPLMYFIVGFLTWLLLIFQVLIVAPIWAVHFVRYEEYKEVITKAAKNYGLQILLKPVFMIVGMVFAWEFIKISLFYVNLTIFSLFSGMGASDSTILSFFHEILFLFVFSGILYIIIKFTLEVISTTSDTLMRALDIEVERDPDNKMSELTQLYLIQKGMEYTQKGSNKIFESLSTDIKSKEIAELESENMYSKAAEKYTEGFGYQGDDSTSLPKTKLQQAADFIKDKAQKAEDRSILSKMNETDAEIAIKRGEIEALNSNKEIQDAEDFSNSDETTSGTQLDKIAEKEEVQKPINLEEVDSSIKEIDQEAKNLLQKVFNNELTKEEINEEILKISEQSGYSLEEVNERISEISDELRGIKDWR